MAATRSNIRKRARIAADQDKSLLFPTEEQYDLIIDDCARVVYNDLVHAGWPVKKGTQTVIPTGSAISLNSGNPIHSVTSVLLDMGGTKYELRRFDESELDAMNTANGGQVTHYEVSVDPLTGPVIDFYPTGSAGGNVTVRYVPDFAGFVTDTQIWHGPSGSDSLIVLMAASQGCIKEEKFETSAKLDRMYEAQWERVINHAPWFDARNSARIRDVESKLAATRDPFDYPVQP